MASRPIRDISDYPRPWFYRPEIYYGLIIFPPVWSILTLRSPWHKGEGFFGIFIGGLAWFFLIASVVFVVKWMQADDEGHRQVTNLFLFVPGVLLTLLTQVQWAAHRAHHGPPPTEDEDEQPATATLAKPPDVAVPDDQDDDIDGGDGDVPGGNGEAPPETAPAETGPPGGYAPRRRRRRRRRPISRSSDSAPLC